MKTTVNVSGLDDVIDTLQRLPERVVSRKGGPVKLALKKGAQLIRDEEKSRLRALLNEQGGNDTTGLLERNIIASRGKRPNFRGERYVVRVKRKIYPPKVNQKETVSTIKVAQIFEYGSEHQPARPYIRPAFQAKAMQAIEVIRTDLLKRIDKLVRKYGLDTDPDKSIML